MKRLRIEITGLVQGVGYRPFAAETAERFSIRGNVINCGGVVQMEVEGEEENLTGFLRTIQETGPEGAVVESVTVTEEPGDSLPPGFSIKRSEEDGKKRIPFLPPDLCTCDQCLTELFSEGNRRFRHPFISCAACGPRYSILRKKPYDREHVTMNVFPLCAKCGEEYKRPGDRRRHAQTLCCPDCGPRLTAISREGQWTGEEAFARAVQTVRDGGVIAVRDIGGFHLACLPDDKEAVLLLRNGKGRETKPFAVCFPDTDSIRERCTLSEKEEELLTSPERPIVLLPAKKPYPPEVSGNSGRIGAFLPCNPLQHLLLRELGPLIMTSANLSGFPMLTETEELIPMMEQGMPGLILTHDREIVSALDDSIYQVVKMSGGEAVQILRRARGIVPTPIRMQESLPAPAFAAGGDLKNVFAFGRGDTVVLSQHFGDCENPAVMECREKEIKRLRELLSMEDVSCSVADMHPGYLTARDADQTVQHHHAHILSVMCEHGLKGPVLGLAFDGTGYGTDGTVWGSEFLLCDGRDFEKKGSLLPVRLPGGDEGARDAILIKQAYLHAAGFPLTGEASALAKALDLGAVGIPSSSLGRLFDAAASVLSICDRNTYEGECAIALEERAHKARQAYPLLLDILDQDGMLYGDGPKLISDLKKNLSHGIPADFLALGFHEAVAEFAVSLSRRIAESEGIRDICLSGGCFLNRILLRRIAVRLRTLGYRVFWNEAVPPGDGGLALGQLYYLTL